MVIGELFGAAFRTMGGFFHKGSYGKLVRDQMDDITGKTAELTRHYEGVVAKADARSAKSIEKANGRIAQYQSQIDDLGADTGAYNAERVRLKAKIFNEKRNIGDAEWDKVSTRVSAGFSDIYDSLGVGIGGALGMAGSLTTKAAGEVIGAYAGAGAAIAGGTLGVLGAGVGAVAKGTGKVLGATAHYAGAGVKAVAGPAAKGAGYTGAALGGAIGEGAKFLWKNRDNRMFQLGVGAVAAGALTGGESIYHAAWDQEANQARLQHKVASNFGVSSDNGGLLLHGGQPAPITQGMRENAAMQPAVQQYEASGDLVFALHNLRNGG